MTMKLSKAQQAVMDHAKGRIDFARSATYFDWMKKAYRLETDADCVRNIEESKRVFGYDYGARRYEEERNGITIVHCNSKTLYKLQEYGLIEIIEDSNGRSYGIDTIKVLNY